MLYPDVVEVQHNHDAENQVILNLHVPTGLDYFSGHFPNMPVLPGVVQIHWAVHYAAQYFPLVGGFTSMEHIKFQSLVLPDAKLALSLLWNVEKQQLEFSFSNSERKYSSGRIVFGKDV
jgi:3-hydroxymyristoyl/3-hydroxydecanoyl-(acyl carrier protein) dehydratase